MTQPQFIDGTWHDPDGLIDTVIAGRAKLMPVQSLQRTVGGHDTEDETCSWIEYRLDGELVHRSVDLKLKKAIFAGGVAANFS